jgi:CIC family chloride channel protein
MSTPPGTDLQTGPPSVSPSRQFLRRVVVQLLRLRVWITEKMPGDLWESAYPWAVAVGLAGACSSVAFREALNSMQVLLLGKSGPLDEASTTLPWYGRLLMPALGGVLAGSILLFGERWREAGKSSDFMEAVVLGNGVIRVRATVVKSLSSLITISSGGSIGREGPMVQLASMLGSFLGRFAKSSPARLRLLVACGAAAGIACSYNAPLTGAFFVAEIVLGSIAMESIGPLIVASVVATVVASQFLGAMPVYQLPKFGTPPNWQLLAHVGLGVVAGLGAPLFLMLLRGGESLFKRLKLAAPAKLGLGGLIVGVISIHHPDVWGNGYGIVDRVLNNPWTWQMLLTVLLFKVIATVATTGSGAVGGVFTPTLFMGAVGGALFGELLRHALPNGHIFVSDFTVVGMGCFLAAMTRAPIMSILIIFEMTREDAVIMPMMLACVASFFVSRAVSSDSVYSRQLHANKTQSETPIFLLHVRDLMKRHPINVAETAGFAHVAKVLASNTFKHLYVVDANHRFLGAIALQDLKPFLHDTDLPQVVIALDLMHEDIPVLTSDASLKESLEVFARHDGERLPVLDNTRDRRLVGALAKTDVLLTLAHGTGSTETGS